MNRGPLLAAGAVAFCLFCAAGYKWLGVLAASVALFAAFRADPVRAFTTEQRRQLLERDGMWCAYRSKGTPCWYQPVHYASECAAGGCPLDYEADHVDPWSKGGATTLDNAVVACRLHNRWKGARPVGEFLEDPDGDGVPGVG